MKVFTKKITFMQKKLRNKLIMFKTREDLVILKWDRLVAKMTYIAEKTKDP